MVSRRWLKTHPSKRPWKATFCRTTITAWKIWRKSRSISCVNLQNVLETRTPTSHSSICSRIMEHCFRICTQITSNKEGGGMRMLKSRVCWRARRTSWRQTTSTISLRRTGAEVKAWERACVISSSTPSRLKFYRNMRRFWRILPSSRWKTCLECTELEQKQRTNFMSDLTWSRLRICARFCPLAIQTIFWRTICASAWNILRIWKIAFRGKKRKRLAISSAKASRILWKALKLKLLVRIDEESRRAVTSTFWCV